MCQSKRISTSASVIPWRLTADLLEYREETRPIPSRGPDIMHSLVRRALYPLETIERGSKAQREYGTGDRRVAK